jgi:hypothetical protein
LLRSGRSALGLVGEGANLILHPFRLHHLVAVLDGLGKAPVAREQRRDPQDGRGDLLAVSRPDEGCDELAVRSRAS